jgi:hypothetical protein
MYLQLPLPNHPHIMILTPANPNELCPGPCTFSHVLPIPGFALNFAFFLLYSYLMLVYGHDYESTCACTNCDIALRVSIISQTTLWA